MPVVEENAFTPLTDNCARLLRDREHAVVAISPFNSYYSRNVVDATVALTHRWFRAVDVILPGMDMCLVFEACGMAHADARRKVARNLGALRTRAIGAFERAGVSRREAQSRVHTLSELEGNAAFDALFSQMRAALQNDAVFRDACLATASGVLTRLNALAGRTPTREQQLAAIAYFIGEAAVLTDGAAIFSQPSSVLCYHRVIEFAAPLFEGRLSWRPAARQGYAVVRLATSG